MLYVQQYHHNEVAYKYTHTVIQSRGLKIPNNKETIFTDNIMCPRY